MIILLAILGIHILVSLIGLVLLVNCRKFMNYRNNRGFDPEECMFLMMLLPIINIPMLLGTMMSISIGLVDHLLTSTNALANLIKVSEKYLSFKKR